MGDSLPLRSASDKPRSRPCTYGARVPQQTVLLLTESLQRLDDRVRRWSNTRWAGETAGGRSHAEAAYELVCTLAELARQAGNGAPQVLPARVGAHAIADQIAVLGRELTSAPNVGGDSRVAEAALEAVERASREI